MAGFWRSAAQRRTRGTTARAGHLSYRRRFDGQYEWAHHLELGAEAGISAAEFEALGGNIEVVAWDPFERATLSAVDQTADFGMISDPTWAILSARLDAGELVELVS